MQEPFCVGDNPTNTLLIRMFDEIIDNAPAVNVEFELKTENGVTYPKALDQMTFSHELSVEEQQNIITAYMLGTNTNIRPHGEWIFDSNFTEFGNPYGTYKCSCCGGHSSDKYSFCKDCGADMRGE